MSYQDLLQSDLSSPTEQYHEVGEDVERRMGDMSLMNGHSSPHGVSASVRQFFQHQFMPGTIESTMIPLLPDHNSQGFCANEHTQMQFMQNQYPLDTLMPGQDSSYYATNQTIVHQRSTIDRSQNNLPWQLEVNNDYNNPFLPPADLSYGVVQPSQSVPSPFSFQLTPLNMSFMAPYVPVPQMSTYIPDILMAQMGHVTQPLPTVVTQGNPQIYHDQTNFIASPDLYLSPEIMELDDKDLEEALESLPRQLNSQATLQKLHQLHSQISPDMMSTNRTNTYGFNMGTTPIIVQRANKPKVEITIGQLVRVLGKLLGPIRRRRKSFQDVFEHQKGPQTRPQVPRIITEFAHGSGFIVPCDDDGDAPSESATLHESAAVDGLRPKYDVDNKSLTPSTRSSLSGRRRSCSGSVTSPRIEKSTTAKHSRCKGFLNVFRDKSKNKPKVPKDNNKYFCTFPSCPGPQSFGRKSEWKRHEKEQHLRRTQFSCIPSGTHLLYDESSDDFLCTICLMKRPKGTSNESFIADHFGSNHMEIDDCLKNGISKRIFYRKKQFMDHMATKHHVCTISEHNQELYCFHNSPPSRTRCGFCREVREFDNWTDRCNHIASDHFEASGASRQTLQWIGGIEPSPPQICGNMNMEFS